MSEIIFLLSVCNLFSRHPKFRWYEQSIQDIISHRNKFSNFNRSSQPKSVFDSIYVLKMVWSDAPGAPCKVTLHVISYNSIVHLDAVELFSKIWVKFLNIMILLLENMVFLLLNLHWLERLCKSPELFVYSDNKYSILYHYLMT